MQSQDDRYAPPTSRYGGSNAGYQSANAYYSQYSYTANPQPSQPSSQAIVDDWAAQNQIARVDEQYYQQGLRQQTEEGFDAPRESQDAAYAEYGYHQQQQQQTYPPHIQLQQQQQQEMAYQQQYMQQQYQQQAAYMYAQQQQLPPPPRIMAANGGHQLMYRYSASDLQANQPQERGHSMLSVESDSDLQYPPHMARAVSSYATSITQEVQSVQEPLPVNSAILPNTEHMSLAQRLPLYRENAKKSNDPHVQLDYVKFLIDAAGTLITEPNPKLANKQRDALVQEALKWTKRLASQGMGLGRNAYPEAQFFLANCYGNAMLGLEVDHEKAFQLYLQASKQNHPKATYRSAVCYELGAGTKRDHARAVQFYRKAAALGDPAAMYKLGVIQLNGLLSQNKNPREAITWLKRAAAQADTENPHALHELGLIYERNVIPSIIADEAYARELFTQAAQLGYAPSQFKMGCCYEYGQLTCPVDPRRSIAWYTKAAEQGDAESELSLSGWYLTGAENMLKQSDTEAYLWARRAADKGLAKAEYAIGYYAEMGIGVRLDLEEARRWYLRAAAQGNKRAMLRLTEMKNGTLSSGSGKRPVQSGKRPAKDDACVLM